MKSNVAHLGGRGRSSRYTMGSGESFLQLQQRLLRDREAKIQKALERLRCKRRLLGQQRRRKEFPVVSVVGYTNCGKTTLIKALTGDAAIQPRNQLFATLDITAHAGRLPSALTVLYMDTIGFLSQLPHSLVESFSATLQDVAHSDLIVHVRDVSHPETELQKASVLSALWGLGLPDALLESMVEVHNKVDLVPGYTPVEPDVLAVSALLGLGLDELMARVEDAVLRATGRRTLTLRVRLAGPQLRCVGWAGWTGGSADDRCIGWGVIPVSGQGHGAGRLCHPHVPTLSTYEQGSGRVSMPRNADGTAPTPTPSFLPLPWEGWVGVQVRSGSPFPSIAAPSRHEQAYGPVSTRQDCGRYWPSNPGKAG